MGKFPSSGIGKEWKSPRFKLTIDKLKTGDILLFADVWGAVTHTGIAFLQTIVSHGTKESSNITHAGFYDEDGQAILEASGAQGLRKAELQAKHHGYTYQVFRCTDKAAVAKQIPKIAVGIGNLFIEKKNLEQIDYTGKGGDKDQFGGYTKLGDFAAVLVADSTKGSGAKKRFDDLYKDDVFAPKRLFYCSNFVVECYEFARTQAIGVPELFGLDFAKVMPKDLQGALRRRDKQWSYEGYYEAEGSAPSFKLSTWTEEVFKEQSSVRLHTRPACFKQIDQELVTLHYIPLDFSETVKGKTRGALERQLKALARKVEIALKSKINKARIDSLNTLGEQISTDLSVLHKTA